MSQSMISRMIAEGYLCVSGELFALCPVDTYPTSVIEQVLDSSRYFVIRIQDGNGWLIQIFYYIT